MATPFDNIIQEYVAASGTVDHVKLDMAQILEKPFANPVDILTVKVLKLALAQIKKEAMDALDGGEEAFSDPEPGHRCPCCDCLFENLVKARCGAVAITDGPTVCLNPVECCKDCAESGGAKCQECLSGDVRDSASDSSDEDGDSGEEDAEVGAEEKLKEDPNRLTKCGGCRLFVRMFAMKDGVCQSEGCTNETLRCYECYTDGDLMCHNCQWNANHL